MIIASNKPSRLASLEQHLEETRKELYAVERNISYYGTDRVRELSEEIDATMLSIDDLKFSIAKELFESQRRIHVRSNGRYRTH